MARPGLDFPPKDLPLRDDVRTLGALVGEVIREQGGEALFEAVETARRAAIRRREDPAGEGEEKLLEVVGSLAPAEAEQLVRAFATYFQVVNLAEKIHRIRRRRDYLRSPETEGGPQPFSLEDTLGKLAAAGVDRPRLEDLFRRLHIEPVFTAHPTEATRRTLLEKQQTIARALVDRLDPSRTPAEERAAMERIRAEVTAAWQTEEQPEERPTVGDEAEHVLFYVTDVLYRILPVFYEGLEEALAAVTGGGGESSPPPPMISFVSWVGGDMDGNPNVTAETLEASLARHRQLVLRLYRREVLALSRRLSQSLSRVGVDGDVLGRIAQYRETFPEADADILPRHREMPYRVLLRLMAARLAATARDRSEGYRGADGYVRDLRLVARSLETHRGARAGLFALRRAERRAETFGFHLATLDVRQDARVHRRVVSRLLGDEGWLEQSVAQRCERLRRELEAAGRPRGGADAEAERTLAVFAAVGRCRRRYGERAVGPYIVSMTRGADDLLSVLLLARWGGLAGRGADREADETGEVPLDVVPLFETVEDLEAAPGVMRELFSDAIYRRHLNERGDRQMVMIGYSDSSKDGGLAASRWALQKGQAALVETFAGAGVELTLFHGRGGTVSRGGGKVHRAVMAAPPGAVAGRLRMTEQGEVIDDKYGLRGIALRTLERTWGAVALATAAPRPAEPREARWREVMDVVAGASRRAYRERVWEDPELAVFFRGATPIDVIERMRIGSRPASRRSGGGIESLRAIPWVFAWTQSRLILPGWYGLGSGLGAALERQGEEVLREMAAEWPFFTNLLDDAEMVLAKTDLAVAERYAGLAGEVGRRLFPEIRAELERTVEAVLRLRRTPALLDSDPTLQRSIRLRNPYVDPMSLLQVDLLRRWREGGRRDDGLLRALVATVHGIAQGLQNTG